MKITGKKTPIKAGFLVLVFLLGACSPQTGATPAPLLPTSAPPSPLPPASQPTRQAPTLTVTTAERPTDPVVTETPILKDVSTFPNGAEFVWILIADGINRPTDMADPQDGSGRLLVLSQVGRVLVVEEGQVLSQPFLDLTGQVGATANERGLLGIALDPGFRENGYFYLNYSNNDGANIISRFQKSAEGYFADPDSEVIFLVIEQPYANHNGGGLEFGPDGYLYIGMGDGGSGGDPQRNAQNINTMLGKMLRIDVVGKDAYTIPGDNPFAMGGGRQEIWALGLRNPWRYSFDRLNGDLFIADVGQNQWEEVNYVPAGSPPGLNFGWHYREGTHAFAGTIPAGLELVDPVYEYGRADGCSVTGGFVYRGELLPEFYGIYLFGDYCTGSVWGLLGAADGQWRVERLFQLNANISSFGEDAEGELYLLDHRGGLYRLERR